jgi:hypothetical protein
MIQAIANKPDSDMDCYRALTILEFMGYEGKDAAPAVVDGLKAKRLQPGWASTTLASIDPRAAMPFLLADLKEGDQTLKKYAAAYLGYAGPLVKDSLPALGESAKGDTDPDFSRIAAWASALVREDYKSAVPLLLRGVKDGDGGYNQGFSSEALKRLGSEAKEAIPILIEALRDKNPKVRLAVASLLQRMGAEAKAAVPSLRMLLQDEDRGVRVKAAEAVEKIERK